MDTTVIPARTDRRAGRPLKADRHKDPHFEGLDGQLRTESLPYKT